MRPLLLVLLLRLSLLIAVTASAALIVDYQNAGDPAFCGVGSGCFAVRISPYSRLLGVPLPYIGLVWHAVLFGGSLIAQTRDHIKTLALAASAGAAGAVILLAVQQFVVGAFCAWCVAVDLSAIAAAASAVLLALSANTDAPKVERAVTSSGAELGAWGAAAAIAIALPFVWGQYPVIPPLAPAAAAQQVPGKVTLINFSDFQCPHCRKLHPRSQELKAKFEGRIHFERRMMPLPGHPGALPAAKAYLCAPPEKREAAADWLYVAPEEALTPAGVLAMAGAIGMSPGDLAACTTSKETEAALARDKQLYEAIGARGLPLTLVGRRMVIGNDPERIESSIEQELKGDTLSLRSALMFAVLGAIFAGAAFSTWLAKRHAAREPSPS
jgi:protein-disulfide isomerase